MKHTGKARRWLVLLLGLIPPLVSATEWEPVTRIAENARQWALTQYGSNDAGRRLEASANPLDTRLRLPKCAGPLHTGPLGGGNPPPLQSRLTVTVGCESPRWSVHVPVSVSLYSTVVTTARPLSRQQILTDADLRLEERDILRFGNSYINDKSAALGRMTQRSVAKGAVLQIADLRSPTAIRRGSEIVLVADAGTIVVRAKGKALADAAVGERVRVQNLSSERIMEGIVMETGIVKIPM